MIANYLNSTRVDSSHVDQWDNIGMLQAARAIVIVFGFFLNLIVLVTYRWGGGGGNGSGSNKNELSVYMSDIRRHSSAQMPGTIVAIERRQSMFINHTLGRTNLNIKRMSAMSMPICYDLNQTAESRLRKYRSLTGSYMLYPNSASARKRNSASHLIMALAVCDLFICTISLPFQMLLHTELASQLPCYWARFFIQAPLILQLQLILAIALNRFSSVFRPIQLYLLNSRRNKYVIGVLVMSSLLISAPNLLFFARESAAGSVSIRTLSGCIIRSRWLSLLAAYEITLCSLFVLLLGFVAVCNLRVFARIYTVSRRQSASSSHTQCSEMPATAAKSPTQIKSMNLGKVLGQVAARNGPVVSFQIDKCNENRTSRAARIQHQESDESQPSSGSMRCCIFQMNRAGRGIEKHKEHDYLRRHTHRQVRHGKSARLLGMATMVFALTWIPYWLLDMRWLVWPVLTAQPSSMNADRSLGLGLAVNLIYLNQVLNPVFFCLIDRRFRRDFYLLFKNTFDALAARLFTP
nr:G protein-coupled receptor [Proales similis]